MNGLKRTLGIVWLIAGPAAWILMVYAAIHYIGSTASGDISNPVPWLIILTIFTPIAYGLSLFGWYSWKSYYDEEKL
jgi:hypothetical protein